MGQGPSVCFQ